MRTTRIIVAALLVGTGLSLHWAQAQKPEIGRTELTRRDLGDSIREVIQTRVDFAPGAAFPKHSHPGVEVAYVLEGSLEYEFDGKPPVIWLATNRSGSRSPIRRLSRPAASHVIRSSSSRGGRPTSYAGPHFASAVMSFCKRTPTRSPTTSVSA